MNELIIRILGEARHFVDAMHASEEALGGFEDKVKETQTSFDLLVKALTLPHTVGKGMIKAGLGIAAGLAAASTYGIVLVSRVEQIGVQLHTTAKSAEDFKHSLEFIYQASLDGAFALKSMGSAAIRLKQVGADLEQVFDSVQDAAVATGRDITETAAIFAQAMLGKFRGLYQMGIETARKGGQVYFRYTNRLGQEIVQRADAHNKQQIASTLNAIWNDRYGGALAQFLKTWQGILHRLHELTEDIFERIGEVVLPVLKTFMQFSVLEIWAGWSNETKNFIVQAVLLVGTLTTLFVTIGGGILILHSFLAVWRYASIAINLAKTALIAMKAAQIAAAEATLIANIAYKAQAFLLGAINVLLSPITLILLALVAVVGILYLAWRNNFLGIQDITMKWADAIVAIWEEISLRFRQVWAMFGPYVKPVVEWIYSLIKRYIQLYVDAYTFLWNSLTAGWETTKANVKGALDFILKAFDYVFGTGGKIMATIKSWWNAIREVIMVAARFWGGEWEKSVARVDATMQKQEETTKRVAKHIEDISKKSIDNQIKDLNRLLTEEETTFEARALIRKRLAKLEEEKKFQKETAGPTGFEFPTGADGKDDAKSSFDAQRAIEDARLAAMEDGLRKQLASSQLSYARDTEAFEQSQMEKLKLFKGTSEQRLALEKQIQEESSDFILARQAQLSREITDLNQSAEQSRAQSELAQVMENETLKYDQKIMLLQQHAQDILENEKLTEEQRQQLLEDANEAIRTANEEHYAALLGGIEQFSQGMQQSLSTAFEGMMTQAQSFEDTMKMLWEGIKATFFKVIADMLAMWIINKIKEFIVGKITAQGQIQAAAAVGSAQAIAAYSSIPFVGLPLGLAAAAATRGAIMAQATMLAEGGIITGPTLGVVGEAGPEAVMPLHKLPEMLGGLGEIGEPAPSAPIINVNAIDAENMERTFKTRIIPLMDEYNRMGQVVY